MGIASLNPSYSSLAGGRVLDLELAHVAADHEIVVVERERARDAVLVELEADRVDRCLLTARGIVAVEIADGDRPAREPGKRRLSGGCVGRQLFVGRNRPP